MSRRTTDQEVREYLAGIEQLETGRENGTGEAGGPKLVTVRLEDVTPERVRWLWPQRLPLGKLVVIEGDPGLGKSALTLDIAARVTTGAAWPDGTGSAAPGDVVIMSAEDGAADTIRPRFDAAGGDASRVTLVTGVDGEGAPDLVSLPEHVAALRAEVDRTGASLVIVDPLNAYLSGSVNAHRDHDVRRALAPLAKLAAATGCLVLVVRHLNKGTGPAIYRGGGSIGIAGAARAVLLVADDPDDANRRVLAAVKSNLALLPPSLTFTLKDAGGAARVVWGGASPLTASQLLAAQTQDDDERSAVDEAVELLREVLADGPVAVLEVDKAARDAGVSLRTYQRARARLGVRTAPDGFGGPRVLRLPDLQSPPINRSLRQPPTMAETGKLGGDRASDHLPGDPDEAAREAMREGA